MYQEIFKQGKIGNITLKNRLVMSPMGTSLAAQRLLFRRLQG